MERKSLISDMEACAIKDSVVNRKEGKQRMTHCWNAARLRTLPALPTATYVLSVDSR